MLGQRVDVRETAPESNAQHFEFRSELLLAPATEPIVPDRQFSKPRALTQTATVVGPPIKKSGPTSTAASKSDSTGAKRRLNQIIFWSKT